jgi:hypothetical protein
MRCEWKAECCTSPRSQDRTMSYGRAASCRLTESSRRIRKAHIKSASASYTTQPVNAVKGAKASEIAEFSSRSRNYAGTTTPIDTIRSGPRPYRSFECGGSRCNLRAACMGNGMNKYLGEVRGRLGLYRPRLSLLGYKNHGMILSSSL